MRKLIKLMLVRRSFPRGNRLGARLGGRFVRGFGVRLVGGGGVWGGVWRFEGTKGMIL